ncbi:MAG: hypothetical protein HWD58_06495 [Bacteroidota bacterium]|nr:MAG: hypothetical protein HWD58_06495 [Bacteroidota bacterium]
MKQLTYILILFLLASCAKEEIISTTSRNGLVIGYSKASQLDTGAASHVVVNHSTAQVATSATWLKLNNWHTQAMYTPQQQYYITAPINDQFGADKGKVYRRDMLSGQSQVFQALNNEVSTHLTYSPAAAKKYVIQVDTVKECEFNVNTNKMIFLNNYPGLGCGNNPYTYSSTAHGYLPYMYIGCGQTIRRLDINSGVYTTITSSLPADIYGLRYNLHDSLVYGIRNGNGTLFLVSYNPITNVIDDKVVEIKDEQFVSAETYSATIHCCENTYIFYQDNKWYNINITTKTVQKITTDKVYQGLIWIND